MSACREKAISPRALRAGWPRVPYAHTFIPDTPAPSLQFSASSPRGELHGACALGLYHELRHEQDRRNAALLREQGQRNHHAGQAVKHLTHKKWNRLKRFHFCLSCVEKISPRVAPLRCRRSWCRRLPLRQASPVRRLRMCRRGPNDWLQTRHPESPHTACRLLPRGFCP